MWECEEFGVGYRLSIASGSFGGSPGENRMIIS